MKKEQQKFLNEFFVDASKRLGKKVSVVNTPWRNTVSKNSKSFANTDGKIPQDEDEVLSLLSQVFGITENEVFKKKLHEACHGSGQEWRRICTRHSSALLALLFFYRVSEDNPLTIKGIKYTKVFFEVKNKVFDNPSNIDVLLVSDDNKTGKNLLFLESKLTEYIKGGKLGKINPTYKKYYELLSDFWNNSSIDWDEEEGKDSLCIKAKGKDVQYCEGIKQMISHYIGLLQCPSEKEQDKIKYKEYKKLFEGDYNFILGEILFKFNDTSFEGYFERYSELYKGLAKYLNNNNVHNSFAENLECSNGKIIQVIEDLITYQELVKDNPEYILNENIKKFYQL